MAVQAAEQAEKQVAAAVPPQKYGPRVLCLLRKLHRGTCMLCLLRKLRSGTCMH